jgi:hypothetical protein
VARGTWKVLAKTEITRRDKIEAEYSIEKA